MFGIPSVRVGRLFGIPLELNPTWFLVFLLVATSLSFSYFPAQFPGRPPAVNVVSGVVTALLFFASIVLHEMSHSLVARAGGIHISRITLFIFGGVAQMEEEPATPGKEFVMAFAGPGMSMLLAAVFAGLSILAAGALRLSDWWWAPLRYLAGINLWVAVFNLLPGFPLDGGRVLRSMLWGATGDLLKATRWAAAAGQFIGFGFISLGVLGVLRGAFDFIWLGLIGWFLWSIAGASYQQQLVKSRFSAVPVRSAMSSPPVVAPGEIDLGSFVDDYVFGKRHSRYPVQVEGRIAGMVDLARVREVPREEWPRTRVAEVSDRDLARLLVPADAPLDTILERLGPEGPGALLVVDDGHLVGIVTRADLAHAVQSMQSR